MQPKYKSLAIAALFIIVNFMSAPSFAQGTPKRIEVTASQFAFSPGEITLKKGQPVLLVLKSQDVSHGLRVRELNVSLKVNAHETTQVQFTPQKAGDFVAHCSVFCGKGHGSMVLTFHVVD